MRLGTRSVFFLGCHLSWAENIFRLGDLCEQNVGVGKNSPSFAIRLHAVQEAFLHDMPSFEG
jgi:hypothetical protein